MRADRNPPAAYFLRAKPGATALCGVGFAALRAKPTGFACWNRAMSARTSQAPPPAATAWHAAFADRTP